MFNITEFISGIFAFRTRRFGSAAEIMIKKLYNLEDSKILNYDKFDVVNEKKIEVKFATVMKKCSKKITEKNIIEQCFILLSKKFF